MISNTDLYYARANEYQHKRKKITDEYEARLVSLEDAKGSKYYTDQVEKAEAERDNALKVLKDEYKEYFRICIEAMERANNTRKTIAPTDEQLRTLQLLKMKEKPTQSELDTAANTLKGNAMCLSVLTEIAHKAGYMRGYNNYAPELSVSDADTAIEGLKVWTEDFLSYDVNRGARRVMEHNKRMYGTSVEPRKRRIFEDKEECFDIVAHISGNGLTAFMNAVDGEGTEE